MCCIIGLQEVKDNLKMSWYMEHKPLQWAEKCSALHLSIIHLWIIVSCMKLYSEVLMQYWSWVSPKERVSHQLSQCNSKHMYSVQRCLIKHKCVYMEKLIIKSSFKKQKVHKLLGPAKKISIHSLWISESKITMKWIMNVKFNTVIMCNDFLVSV